MLSIFKFTYGFIAGIWIFFGGIGIAILLHGYHEILTPYIPGAIIVLTTSFFLAIFLSPVAYLYISMDKASEKQNLLFKKN